MSIVEKLGKDLLKTQKAFIKANKKAVSVYSNLHNQSKLAQSKPLNVLLTAEVDAYMRLTAAANDYFEVQAEFNRICNERDEKIIKSGAHVDVDDLQKCMLLAT